MKRRARPSSSFAPAAKGSVRVPQAVWHRAALCALALLALPPARQALESSMSVQMLVQFPLLALCGFVLAGALPVRWRLRLDSWNGYGIAGLFAVALVMAILMIPRVLDLALADGRIELAKWLALVLAGAALRVSWRRGGLLVQGFFLGNVLPMTAAVGQLYQDSPIRLCNSYLLDDQVRLGQMLVALAMAVGITWFAQLIRVLMRREGAALPPELDGSAELALRPRERG
jgi:hypothetical protein